MADATYYVDFNAGANGDGHSASSPYRTLRAATADNAHSHNSGDTITIRVINKAGGARNDMATLTKAKFTSSFNGVNWLIIPHVDPYIMIGGGANPLFNESQIGGSVTLRSADILQDAACNTGVSFTSNDMWMHQTLDSCVLVAGAANMSIINTNQSGTQRPNITLRNCVISGFARLINNNRVSQAPFGAISISGNYGTNMGVTTGTPRNMVTPNGCSSFSSIGNTWIGGTGCNGGYWGATGSPLECTSVNVYGDVVDWSAGANPSAYGYWIRVDDSDPAIAVTLNVTIRKMRLKWVGIDGQRAIQVGRDDITKTRAALEALMSNTATSGASKLGIFTFEDNVVTTTTGGILGVEVGCNDAVIRRNVLTGGTSHNVLYLGKRVTWINNQHDAGALSLMVMGDDGIFANNNISCDDNAVLMGHRSGSSEGFGYGNIIVNNYLVSRYVGLDKACVSDYAYNVGEPDGDGQTNTVDNNCYYCPNGAGVARLRAADNKCATVAEAVSAWNGYGPTRNDRGSIVGAYNLERGGNCDVGRGDPTVRAIGSLDLYGRPKLRADADCIGAVYPQRKDARNVLQPVMQLATEAV